MQKSIAFIHASRAAVDPVTRYYAAHAPEWELTNLLDDGVMRALSCGDAARTIRRLQQMVDLARYEYKAEIAMLTCSAVSRDAMRQLRKGAPIPLIKIDEPMARCAVQAGRRIGVVATFPATADTTRRLLEEAAEEDGKDVEIEVALDSAALQALLDGRTAEHDEGLLRAVEGLSRAGVDTIVLAQVSMARLAGEAARRAGVPVWNSLDTSFEAVSSTLG